MRKLLENAGFKDIGICKFSSLRGNLFDVRAKQRIPENAKTVIVFLFPYLAEGKKPKYLSRYAAVPDYHTVCGAYLKRAAELLRDKYPQNKFEYFIDNSPVNEVLAAAKADLGVIGENGLLINEKYGSFVFIGEIITDLKVNLAESEPAPCLKCGKCRKACPVGLNKEKCLSAISQKKGELSKSALKILKGNEILWGCDICAEVCPMKKNEKTYIEEFITGYRNEYILGEDSENRAYIWRGEEPIKRNYVNLTLNP